MDDVPLHPAFATTAPGSVTLAPHDLHVWAVPLTGESHTWTHLLSPGEVQRLQRFRFADHARRYEIGHGALRVILAGYMNEEPAAIQFTHGPRGKPFVAGSGPFFNLSHSGKLALIGVAPVEVGLDVEKVRHLESLVEIARRHFSPSEFDALSAMEGEQRQLAFYRCWTRKEAYIKALGEGLSMPLDVFDVSLCEQPRLLACRDGREGADKWSMVDVSPGPEFVGAAVLRTQNTSVRCFRMPPSPGR